MAVREVLFYEFDDFRLDVKRQELLNDGVPVSLTHKAFRVLHILVQNFGQTVEKEYIYKELWADSFVEDSNLTQHIYVLRKTLGRSLDGDSYIETVARSGYRFTSAVKAICVPAVVPMPETAEDFYSESGNRIEIEPSISKPYLTLLRNAQSTASSEEIGLNDLPTHSNPSKTRLLAVYLSSSYALALVSIFAVTVLGIFLYTSRQSTPVPVGGQSRSIAVLPFTPVGQESSNEKLGLGMADAVITRLGKLRDVPVRPTSAVFRYTDRPPENSSVAGREMGVDTVLEGTVQRDADRVRISVRLMSVADGKTLWAENFDENFTNIFAVQDSISAKVVRALEIKLTQQQTTSLTVHSTTSTEAYQAFQLGVYFGNLRTKDEMEKAIAYFQKAIDADPNFARAHAMQADTYNMLGYYRFRDRQEMRKKAEEATDKALALDDRLAEAYISLGFIKLNSKGGFEEAKAAIKKAIELAPFNSTARVRYGWQLFEEMNLDGTVEQMRLAQEYDPLSSVSNGALCEVLGFQKKFDEAVKYCERSVEISASTQNMQIALAEAYFAADRRAEAVELIRNTVNRTQGLEHLSALGTLGYFYAKLGNRSEATRIVLELLEHAVSEPSLLNDLVVISYALGDRDDGYAYFDQLYKYKMAQKTKVFYYTTWEDARTDERIVNRMNEVGKS